MKRFVISMLVLFFLCCGLVLPAQAKVRESISENYDNIWSAAVRFIRVDKDWKILDKDKDAGFIVFMYTSEQGEASRASIELMKDADNPDKAKAAFVIQVSIPKSSSIQERMLITDLRAKIREEF